MCYTYPFHRNIEAYLFALYSFRQLYSTSSHGSRLSAGAKRSRWGMEQTVNHLDASLSGPFSGDFVDPLLLVALPVESSPLLQLSILYRERFIGWQIQYRSCLLYFISSTARHTAKFKAGKNGCAEGQQTDFLSSLFSLLCGMAGAEKEKGPARGTTFLFFSFLFFFFFLFSPNALNEMLCGRRDSTATYINTFIDTWIGLTQAKERAKEKDVLINIRPGPESPNDSGSGGFFLQKEIYIYISKRLLRESTAYHHAARGEGHKKKISSQQKVRERVCVCPPSPAPPRTAKSSQMDAIRPIRLLILHRGGRGETSSRCAWSDRNREKGNEVKSGR
eukprot:gene11047-7680_t